MNECNRNLAQRREGSEPPRRLFLGLGQRRRGFEPRRRYGQYLLIGAALCFFTSCKSLQAYERIYVNDREMKMDLSGGQAFENYVESIREAALPAGGQKASGGCGCN